MDKAKWIENVLESVNGIEKAQPSSNLLQKIERQLFDEANKVISINQIKKLAVAASFLVMFNAFVVYNYSKVNTVSTLDMENYNFDNQLLISDFKLYDL